MLGFELGNELDGGDYTTGAAVAPDVFANDYQQLRSRINTLWLHTDGRPYVVGPAMHIQATWLRHFLATLGHGVLDLFSFHDYVAYGLDPLLSQKIMDPLFLDAYWDQAEPTIELAKNLQPGADIIIGETSAAWHSGQCGVTDRFYGSFWYANSLGRMARGGVNGFCRHNFNGGCYAMINRTDMQPNPDWWIAHVWGELMGEEVLDLRPFLIDPVPTTFRTYAHKSKRFPTGLSGSGSGATLLLINVSPSDTFTVVLSDYAKLMAPRYEYHITATALDSDVVRLNGTPMSYDHDNGKITDVVKLGTFVNNSAVPITIAPHSIVFVDLADAMVY